MDDSQEALKRFRDEGLLWLINTSILHPRGMALAVYTNPAGEPEALEVIDFGEYAVFEANDALHETLDRYCEAEAGRERSMLRIPEDHIVEIDSDGSWALEHPLTCREGGKRLLDCPLHAVVRDHSPPPSREAGRYRVGRTEDVEGFATLGLERITDE